MKRIAVVALVVLVALAGCSGAQTGGGGGADSAATQTVAETDGSGAEPTAKSGSAFTGGEFSMNARVDLQARYRVKTASMEVRVSSYDAARDTLVSKTKSLGGYVDSVDRTLHRRDNATWTTGRLVLRVPKDHYDELLATINRTGTVTHKEVNTKDVTAKVVDLRARLKNLKAQRDRLRTLYENANKTETILEVGQRLSEVQGQIEQVQGRLRVLRNRVAYSTVTVELSEPRPDREDPKVTAWYETSVVAAFLESAHGVVVVGRGIVVGIAYLAPYAFAFGAPVAVVYAGVRRYR